MGIVPAALLALGMVDFQRIHPWVAEKINLLARTGNHAQSISWHDWFAVMNETSGILLIFFSPSPSVRWSASKTIRPGP